MEKLNFKLEFADNGVIVTDNSSGSVNVYQEKRRRQLSRIYEESYQRIRR